MINGVVTNGTLESRLAVAVDEFLATSLQDRPAAEAFASRYPELADHLRQVLPALALLEPSAFGPDESPGLAGTLGDFRLLREVGRGGMASSTRRNRSRSTGGWP
jgi:hypothetical protein